MRLESHKPSMVKKSRNNQNNTRYMRTISLNSLKTQSKDNLLEIFRIRNELCMSKEQARRDENLTINPSRKE